MEPEIPGDPGEAICKPNSRRRAVDLEQLDVDDDLGPGLVDRCDQARCSGDVLGRVLERDRVDGGHARGRTSTTMRSRSMTSFISALLRYKVWTTDSSYSRRLAAVSGMMVIVRCALTR